MIRKGDRGLSTVTEELGDDEERDYYLSQSDDDKEGVEDRASNVERKRK